jgi:hypothetical protein
MKPRLLVGLDCLRHVDSSQQNLDIFGKSHGTFSIAIATRSHPDTVSLLPTDAASVLTMNFQFQKRVTTATI